MGPGDLPASPPPAPPKPRRAVVLPQAPRLPLLPPAGARGSSPSGRRGLGVGVPGSSGGPASSPTRVSVPGGWGRGVLGQGWGSGRLCSEPGLVLVGLGAGSLGLFSLPPPPVPVSFCPLPSSCLGPLPTLPCLCWASCLAGPGALLAPRMCSLGSGPQLGACLDPALLGPAGSGEWWSPPALLSEGWGSAGREAVRLALGWHFLSPPPPSLAEAGRELVGVPRLPSGGPGRGGRQEGPGGLSGGGSLCSWGLSAGGMPPGPQREPRASCLAMPELAYSCTGSSPPQEAACACTMGTVSDFAECALAPLPRGPVGTAVLWALSLLGISSLPRGICFWPPDVCVYSVSFTA